MGEGQRAKVLNLFGGAVYNALTACLSVILRRLLPSFFASSSAVYLSMALRF
jgi:hypothetical protein